MGIHERPFAEGWIFCEFFFILSGYFTFAYFSQITSISMDDMAKRAIKHTIRKYKAFFPYVVLSQTFAYLLTSYDNHITKTTLINFLFDITLLRGTFVEQPNTLYVFWFLLALFTAYLPFCIMCQCKSKYVVYIGCFISVLLYYGYFGYKEFPCVQYLPACIRAFIGLSLGVLVYSFSKTIEQQSFSSAQRLALTVFEIIILAMVVVCLYFNRFNIRLFLLFFVMGLSVTLSKQSYTYKIRGKIFTHLGKISRLLFCFHTCVAIFISRFFFSLDNTVKLLIYFMLTIAASEIINICFTKFKKLI